MTYARQYASSIDALRFPNLTWTNRPIETRGIWEFPKHTKLGSSGISQMISQAIYWVFHVYWQEFSSFQAGFGNFRK
jgi:hypothetical protein